MRDKTVNRKHGVDLVRGLHEEIDRTVSASVAMAEEVNAIRELILRTHQRAITGRHLEPRIWQIWSHVRENRNSLDSERACRIVREVIESAVSDVAKRLEEVTVERDRMQRENKKLQQQINTMQEELDLLPAGKE